VMLMAELQKRATATKVRIADILGGNYSRQEGWQPSFIQTADGRQISRVNIMGVITSRNDVQSFVLEDASGSIIVRSFEAALEGEIGDFMLVIGRPREYNGSKYISPEIFKKISDIKLLELRKAELELIDLEARKKAPIAEVKDDSSAKDRVLSIVRALDLGPGAEFDAVARALGSEGEQRISKLLQSGELFQIRPGRIKVLE